MRTSRDVIFHDGEDEKSLIADQARQDTALSNEATRAQGAEQNLADLLAAETARAIAAEDALAEELENKVDKTPSIYGVRIDTTNSNPATAVTYTDAASGFNAASGNNGAYAAGGIDGVYPWNAIKPCLFQGGAVVGYLNPSDFTQWADGHAPAPDIMSGDGGDVMIEIPHFYYKFERIGNYLEVKVANTQLDGYTDAPFRYKGIIKDRFYVGAYLGYKDGGGKLRSISGVMPTASQTIGQFRTAAQANGDGYEQLSFYKLTALQILYLIQFKSLDSQTALGRGYTSAGAYRNTGATNQNGMNHGTNTAAVASDTVKCLGVEDFWGNFYQWVDGYKMAQSGDDSVYIADGDFNNTGDGYTSYPANPATNGSYIKEVVGNNELAFTPADLAGSSSTYYCDYGYLHNGSLPVFGGYRVDGRDAGAFYFDCNYSASLANSSIGARLLFCG